jgi:hypothetical protein
MCRHSSKEDSKVLNSAQVADCKFSVSVGSKRPHVFDITTDKKTFYVQCDSEMMMNHWLGVLNDAQFHFRQQAAEAEAASARAAAPTMIGIGVVLKAQPGNGVFTIEKVIEGGPADKSQKFLVGDFVVEVEGNLTVGVDFDTVLSWIRGELGTFVTVVVARVTDFEVMERTATDDNPFGEGADIISIELKRDVVKKIDIYGEMGKDVVAALSLFGAMGMGPETFMPTSKPAPPPLPSKAKRGSMVAETVFGGAAAATPANVFVFQGMLGKSKGSGLMGMMGYQDRYFTLDAGHLTWYARISCLYC